VLIIKNNLNKFKQITVAFYSSFNSSGDLNVKAIRDLCRFYIKLGVRSFYLCGSSGEGLLLKNEERKMTVETVMEEVYGKATVIVHVGTLATRDSIELARHAEYCNVDAISSLPTIFYRVPEIALENYWLDIMDSTSLPMIIYNIPDLCGYDISYNLFKRMIVQDKVIGIKNTSASIYQTQQFKAIAGKDFIVFNGKDEQYLAGRMMGAEGGIGGTYGIMPELFLSLEDNILNGNIDKAQEMQVVINEIITELLSFNCLYSALKMIVKLRGVDIGSPRLPLLSLSNDENLRIEQLYKKLMDCLQNNS